MRYAFHDASSPIMPATCAPAVLSRRDLATMALRIEARLALMLPPPETTRERKAEAARSGEHALDMAALREAVTGPPEQVERVDPAEACPECHGWGKVYPPTPPSPPPKPCEACRGSGRRHDLAAMRERR
jgi:hypothetical protein